MDPYTESLPEDPRESLRPRHPAGVDTLDRPPVRTWSTWSAPGPGTDAAATTGLPEGWNDSHYLFEELIGVGGVGEVWRAVQVSLGRIVAVKRLRLDRSLTETGETARRDFLNRRFYDEALITARLEHPNIVPVYDIGQTPDGEPLLAMKLVRGRPWSEVLQEDFAQLSPEGFLHQHLPVFVDMMQAVAFAHSRGIIHRDLKPSQVMLGEFGEVVLLDWGLAMYVGDHATPDQKPEYITGTDTLPNPATATNPSGTPALMAPEQTLESAEKITPLTDVYLLGGVLYFLLTGTFPHDAETSHISMRLAARGEIDPPEERAPDRHIPADLSELATRALQHEPEQRVPSVQEFIRGIKDYLSGAGARRESVALTGRARERLQQLERFGLAIRETGDSFRVEFAEDNPSVDTVYTALEEIRALLERALSFWGANPELLPLRDRVTAAWAMTAAATGDLRLGRHLASQVTEAPARESLLRRLDEEDNRLRRKDRTRSFALFAAAALLFAVMAGYAKYLSDISEANESLSDANERLLAQIDESERSRLETLRQREIAEHARAEAEQEQYFATMNFADASLKEGNPAKVRELLLLRTPPHLRHWEWGYLFNRVSGDAMTLVLEDGPENLLGGIWSPDGSVIYSGNRSGELGVWDARTGNLEALIPLHEDGIWDVAPSPDGSLLLTCSFDETAKILDAETFEVLHTLEGHGGVLRGGAFSPDGENLLTTSRDATLRSWAPDGSLRYVSTDLEESSYDTAFLPGGEYYVVAERRSASLREAATGNLIARTPRHPENVLGVAVSPDGNRLVTACTDRVARVFSLPGMTEVIRLENRTSWLHSVDWSPDGQLIATSDNEGDCRLWDANTGELLQTIRTFPRVFHVRFSPQGRHLLTVSTKAIQVWDLDNLSPADGVDVLAPDDADSAGASLTTQVWAAPLEYDGSWLGYDHRFRDSTGNGRFTYSGKGISLAVDSWYTAIRPGTDTETAVQIDYPAQSATVHTPSGEIPWPHEDLYSVQWSPDGSVLGVITMDGLFALHDGETLERTASLGDPSPLGEFTSARVLGALDFDHASQRVFTGRRDGSADVWDAATGEHLLTLEGSEPGVFAGAFSPDGSLVAAGGLSSQVTVWDATTGEKISVLSGHRDSIIGIEFHPDNRRIVTASQDDAVKLWETASGREVMTAISLPGHDFLLGAGFCENGKRIYAIGSDTRLHVAKTLDWNHRGDSADVLIDLELEKRLRHLGPHVRREHVDLNPGNPVTGTNVADTGE